MRDWSWIPVSRTMVAVLVSEFDDKLKPYSSNTRMYGGETGHGVGLHVRTEWCLDGADVPLYRTTRRNEIDSDSPRYKSEEDTWTYEMAVVYEEDRNDE